MRTYQTIHLRRFTVQIMDERTGESREDVIVLTKEQLQAAQVVGQSSKELICRHYNRAGFTVLDIGKAEKRTIGFNLGALWDSAYGEEQSAPLANREMMEALDGEAGE